jgi:predicted RNA-binding protein
MKTYLCVVSPRFPENYHIGVQSQTWGVEKNYKNRIAKVHEGDELVFLASQEIRSIHRIESEVYEETRLLWPPKDGDVFPYRIKISKPLYAGMIPKDDFVPRISFMSVVDKWGGTIQGASGVFNDRLTEKDVDFIKSRLIRVAERRDEVAETLKAVEEPKIQNLFRLIGSDVLESLKRILPSLGLVRYNGADFPAEYDLGYGGNVILCRRVENGDLVVVDFNRGEAPNDTLLRLLHYMSWVRQNLAGSKNVLGMILTESANESLKAIVSEIPNVSLRFYRIGIELLDENARLSA